MAQMKSTVWGQRNEEHVDLGGSALVFGATGDPVGEYTVRDLTSRGALLSGRSWSRTTGTHVHVVLALPSRSEPLEVWGDVDRFVDVGPGSVDLDLRFTDLSADDEDLIEDAILLEWSRLRSAHA